ncbi:hypothetical protein Nepgr_020468 [Nepenthes gracilis]|uniref:BHLH domain-containing protein n=1 Tax=Nepenthes gracilis TaxID=150966 RepID=A0AAD3XV35_NEPGR|nr:hypothetical protein Nepgr_020468 [Nepenthes gracilis]
MENQPGELNFSADCFFNPNWDNSIDQNDPFESGLSSIVSSPTASYTGGGFLGSGDSLMMRELVGRLGSICNSGEVSHSNNNSTNTSCYSTPLSSPPKSNHFSSNMENKFRGGNLQFSGNRLPYHPSLPTLNADPGFVERAAKYSCFGSRNLGEFIGQSGPNQSELPCKSVPKLEFSRVPSCQSMKVAGFRAVNQENKSGPFGRKLSKISRPPSPENAKLRNSREGSSVSEQNPSGQIGLKAQNEANPRKRKPIPNGKGKEIPCPSPAKDEEVDEVNAKRSKSDEDPNNEIVKGSSGKKGNAKTTGEDDQEQKKEVSKAPEPPKDYIHVRARRGQATDSHSIAERVRREKISERMKFLQDLVPGCSKVTGKAVVLDEIINYVQSLQRQVEFLSMKLATGNSRMDFNLEALLSHDISQSGGSMPQTIYKLDSTAQALSYSFHEAQKMQPLPNGISNSTLAPVSIDPLNAALLRSRSIQLPSTFNSSMPQVPMIWEDDLQTVAVQTGFVPNQTQSFHGQMKLQL